MIDVGATDLSSLSDNQRAFLLAKANTPGITNIDACEEVGISKITFYQWRNTNELFKQVLESVEAGVEEDTKEDLPAPRTPGKLPAIPTSLLSGDVDVLLEQLLLRMAPEMEAVLARLLDIALHSDSDNTALRAIGQLTDIFGISKDNISKKEYTKAQQFVLNFTNVQPRVSEVVDGEVLEVPQTE